MAKNEDDVTPEDIDRIPAPEAQTVSIDLEKPDDDDDDDETPVAAKDRDPKTGQWKEKKAQRAAEHKGQKKWDSERAEMQASFDRRIQEIQSTNDRRFAETEARISRQQSSGAPADPHDAKIADIEQQLQSELKLIEADPNRSYERYNQLRRAETQAVTAKTVADMMKVQQATQQAQPRDPYASRAPIIESEFPWTLDARAKPLTAKAWSYRQYLIEFEGRPDTLDTDREALSHTMATYGAQYGFQPPPARPSPQQRQMYQRPAPGPAAGRQQARTIELPRELVDGAGLSSDALRRALSDVER